MDGCTDGVCLFNGVRYFICRPNRAFFCPLGQLVPDHNLVLNSASKFLFLLDRHEKCLLRYVAAVLNKAVVKCIAMCQSQG